MQLISFLVLNYALVIEKWSWFIADLEYHVFIYLFLQFNCSLIGLIFMTTNAFDSNMYIPEWDCQEELWYPVNYFCQDFKKELATN